MLDCGKDSGDVVLERLPGPSSLWIGRLEIWAFLLLHAAYVSQWAFDYVFYEAWDMKREDICCLLAVQQVALVLGRVLPLARVQAVLVFARKFLASKSCGGGLSRALTCAAAVVLAVAMIAKRYRCFYTAAAVQGFLASVVATRACPHEDPRVLSVRQGYMSLITWMLIAVQVDIVRYDVSTVYWTACGFYVGAAVCLLLSSLATGRSCSWEKTIDFGGIDCDSECSSADYDLTLNSKLLRLALFVESTSRLGTCVSSICAQTAAILARVAFPDVAAVSCYGFIPSLPALLMFRLVLEQLGRSQAMRWNVPVSRWVFLLVGYGLSVLAMMIHFQTRLLLVDLCGSQVLLAYSTALACGAIETRPAWEADVAGLLSAAILVWPPGQLEKFDAALAWASFLFLLGVSSAILSLITALKNSCHPTGGSYPLPRGAARLRRDHSL